MILEAQKNVDVVICEIYQTTCSNFQPTASTARLIASRQQRQQKQQEENGGYGGESGSYG